jgi:3',5'-cyclic AMP phosphodiesterase CpdA
MSSSLLIAVLALALTAGSQEAQTPPASETFVMVGAGDIANCELIGGAEATAKLLDRIEGTVFTLGDHAYQTGSAREFRDCYEPTWGRHKARTRPVPGNHDVVTAGGRAYFEYFGENAGPDRRGYYSYDLGSWHIVALNSTVSGNSNSEQAKWLREDLAANASDCILAYWHVPVFSSGPHGRNLIMRDIWRILYEAGAEVILNGHDHVYERFGPQDYRGNADPVRGIRAFTVGTGGSGVYKFKTVAPNSEVRDAASYGVLKLTLMPGKYTWEFIGVNGSTRDAGSGVCTPAGVPPAVLK